MKRIILLAVVALLYGTVLAPPRAAVSRRGRIDPLTPKARSVEQAIAAGRFADALPVALEISRTYQDDPLPDLWLTTIYRSLDRPEDEAAHWERYVTHSSVPERACPAMAEAYARFAPRDRIVAAYARCAEIDARDPQRFIDLGTAYDVDGHRADALVAYRRARALDPADPSIARRIRAVEGEAH